MEFLIQHNLMAEEQVLAIKDAIRAYPHRFVEMIPFSHEIVCENPIDGIDFIPYGSTLMTSVAQRNLGWKGLFFSEDTFNYQAALDNRDDMLNGNVIPLISAIDILSRMADETPDRLIFTRPSHDLKQFAGQIIRAEDCLPWFKSIIESDSSQSSRLDANTPIILAEPQPIQAEWRWFIVGGKVVSGSMYRARGQMRKIRATEPELITEAQELADKWLPSPCCVMDLALINLELKVIEFNCINSSGFYDHDINAIFGSLYDYCNIDPAR